MTILKLKISGNILDDLVNYLILQLNFDYENHSTDMSILYAENFYFTKLATHGNMLVLKKESSYIKIDIVAGLGNTGLLNLDRRIEREYTWEIGTIIRKYAEENSLEFEYL